MADDRTDTPSGAATPKGKLESLSKEDLIKFVKRQTILLQKSKVKNSELENKVQELEKCQQDSSDNANLNKKLKALEEELQELNKEKQEVVLAYNAVQSSQETCAEQIKKFEEQCITLQKEKDALHDKFVQCDKINKNLLEESECLKMKNETLTSTLQCLQQEFSLASDSNKLLISEKSSLQIKLEDLEEEALSWKTEKESLLKDVSNSTSLNEKFMKAEKENQTLRTKLELMSKLNDELTDKLDKMESNSEQRREQIDLLQAEINRLHSLETEKQSLCVRLEEAEKLVEQLKSSSVSSNSEKNEASEQIQSLVQEIEAFRSKEQQNKDDFINMETNLKNEIEKLKLEKEEILATNLQLKTDLERANLENSKLEQSLKDLEECTMSDENKGADDLESQLKEKQKMLDFLQKELSDMKLKLSDSEAKPNAEGNDDVVQTLKQELANAQRRISELESANGPGVSEEMGWSDLPDIQEESEKDSQDDQSLVISQPAKKEMTQSEENDAPVFVYTERIEKLIKVSNHVVEETTGELSRIEILKAKIIELEKEKTSLSLALEEAQIKGQVTLSGTSSDLDLKYAEIIGKLQDQKQHLAEKLAVLGDRQETLTFELVEMQAERESMKSELDSLHRQLQEWENMMSMLKEEKDSLAQELEESANKDAALRKELEFLLSSLNEAITERDTLQDEVFKLSQHEDSAHGDVKEMKGMIQDIIMERNSLLSELDSVLFAKSEVVSALEALKQEKEDIEREKETLLVRLHVGKDLHNSFKEENEGLQEKCLILEKTIEDLKQQMRHISETMINSTEIKAQTDDAEKTADLESQVENSSESNDVVKSTMDDSVHIESDGDHSQLISELHSKQEELECSQDQLFSAKQNLEDEIQSLISFRSEAEEAIKKLSNELLGKEEERKVLANSLEETMSKLGISDQKIEQLLEEKNQRIQELKFAKENHQECDLFRKQFENELGEAKLLVTKYQQEVTELWASLCESQSSLQQKDAELALSLQEKSDLVIALEDLQTKLSRLETEHKNATGLEEDLISEKQTLLASIAERQEMIQMYQQKSAALEQELSQLRESTASSQQSSSELLVQLQQNQAQLVNVKESLNNVLADLENERHKADSLEQVLADLKATHETRSQDMQANLVQLTEEKNQLVETLHQQNLQFSELETKFNEIHSTFQEKCKSMEEENSKVISDKNILQEEFHRKSEELQVRDVELSALKQMIESLNTNNQVLTNKDDSISGQVVGDEESTSSKKDISQILTASEELKSQLLSKLEQLQKEHSELLAQLKLSETTVVELKLHLETSSTKFEELNVNYHSQVHENESLASTLKVLSSEKENLASLLNELNLEKESLASDLKELSLEKENLETTLKDLSSEKENLASFLSESNSEKENLASTLKELSSEKESLETTLKDLSLEKENLASLLSESNSEKESLASALKELSSEKESLETTLKDLSSEKKNLASFLSESNSEKESLASALKELSSEKERLETTLKDLSSEKENLASFLSESNSEKESLASALKELSSEKESLETTLKDLSSEKKNLASFLSESNSEKESLASALKELSSEKERLETTLKDLSSEKENLASFLSESNSEKENLTSKLKEVSLERESLTFTLKELTAVKEELEMKLQASCVEIEDLKQTLAEVEKSVNSKDRVEEVKVKLLYNEGEVKADSVVKQDAVQTSSESLANLETLRKELAEKEKLNSKLKQLAIKAKKELGEKHAELEAVLKELKLVTKRKEELELAMESIQRQSGEASDSLSQQLKTLQDNYKNSLRATPTTSKSEHEKKRPKDMSPNELRKYRSSQRKAQIAALSHQKKAALRLKDRERKRKMCAMLARISSRLAQPSDRVGRLKQSAYNLNNELKPKTKKYTQTALNPLNPGTPEKKQTTRKQNKKKQPCLSRSKIKKSDSPDIKKELGIQLEDSFLEEPEQEDISKPVYNTLQKLQASLDVVQDEAEKAKEDRKQANKDIEQLVTQLAEFKGQLASSKEEREGLLRQIDTLKADLKVKDGSCDEMKTKMKASETELYVVRLQLEEINKEKQFLEHKMAEAEAKWKSSEEDYKSQITKLEVCMKDLQEQLTSARQSMKQNSMLDLEMADYERTLSTLHNQVEERDKKIEELKAELDKLDQRIILKETQISASEEQRVQADARANKLKSLLVKTKKELSDARQQETTQKSSELQLKAQLEEMIQQNEELKVQISDLTVDSQKLQEKVKGQNESSARTVKSLESKVDSLTEELQMTRRELEIIQADYDNYKVRAHNVLKQQKARSPSDATVEVDKQERARYENAIDQLKGKLQEAYEKLELSRKDLEVLQNEHDHLAQRHSKLISDLEDKETHFKSRLEELQKDKNNSVNELMEKITSLEVQKTFLSQKHKEHIVRLKDDHESAIELLQKQMEVSEMDNIRLQREIQSLQRSLKNREEAGGEHSSPHDFHPITVHPGEERQEGEGSEVVDTEPVRLIKPSAQPPAFTFEQLIATPMNELPGMKSPPPQVDEETLKLNLSVSQKKIEHLTELLSESEASVSMLTEQARILKEEIRRLERNIERERETQNMEYLKNIFLQFVCPKVGEQRQQLVPVLATMLKLSPEEKARIVAVAQSDEGGQQGAQGAGWGAYLHRWSGLT